MNPWNDLQKTFKGGTPISDQRQPLPGERLHAVLPGVPALLSEIINQEKPYSEIPTKVLVRLVPHLGRMYSPRGFLMTCRRDGTSRG